jgi:hypothetical protein
MSKSSKKRKRDDSLQTIDIPDKDKTLGLQATTARLCDSDFLPKEQMKTFIEEGYIIVKKLFKDSEIREIANIAERLKNKADEILKNETDESGGNDQAKQQERYLTKTGKT